MKNPVSLFAFALLFATNGFAQTVPVGAPLMDEAVRRLQMVGEGDSATSFLVRPLHLRTPASFDSLYDRSQNAKTDFRWLPLTLRQQVNTHHPFGWNDGAMVPANGYQALLSAGVWFRTGPLSVQLQPEAVLAENKPYQPFPTTHSDALWRKHYETVWDRIDQPDRFGRGVYARLFPGQSSIRLHYKKLSFGLSTENLWWGPGVRNSLLMSNTAPGFAHLTLNTTAPLKTAIGSFEGQLIGGLLNASGYLPFDTMRRVGGQQLYTPKPNEDRYVNGVVATWQPKWTPGLYLGLSRVFYLYRSAIQPGLGGYLPVISQLFKGNENDAFAEDAKKRDQMFSFFLRLVLPKEKAEVYGEFGRNDHSGNARDILLEPEHSSAYILGLRKLFDTKKADTDVELLVELTNLQIPTTQLVREQGSWYAHYQVRDGYTHKGQVIGAGIGPGANSQSMSLSLVKGVSKTGILVERILRNNDFYYAAFAPARNYMQHWVDMSVQVHKSWRHKRLLYDARITWVKSYNYQWLYRFDPPNIQLGLTVSHLFQ